MGALFIEVHAPRRYALTGNHEYVADYQQISPGSSHILNKYNHDPILSTSPGESSFASIGPAAHELIVVAATIRTNLTSQTIMISNSRESLSIASEDDSGTSQGPRK